jgi:hypothetical protein
MRRMLVAVVVVAATLFGTASPGAASDPVPESACSLNYGLARAWFSEPPIEDLFRGSHYTGEVVVHGNIWCRHVSVTARFAAQYSYGPVMYGVSGACVPDPAAVGGTSGWCAMRTVQSYQEIGTMIHVDVEAVGVDDLGLPVRRTGGCWLSYYYGEGPYQSCNPW